MFNIIKGLLAIAFLGVLGFLGAGAIAVGFAGFCIWFAIRVIRVKVFKSAVNRFRYYLAGMMSLAGILAGSLKGGFQPYIVDIEFYFVFRAGLLTFSSYGERHPC